MGCGAGGFRAEVAVAFSAPSAEKWPRRQQTSRSAQPAPWASRGRELEAAGCCLLQPCDSSTGISWGPLPWPTSQPFSFSSHLYWPSVKREIFLLQWASSDFLDDLEYEHDSSYLNSRYNRAKAFSGLFYNVSLLIMSLNCIYLLTCHSCFHFCSLLGQVSETSLQKKHFLQLLIQGQTCYRSSYQGPCLYYKWVLCGLYRNWYIINAFTMLLKC